MTRYRCPLCRGERTLEEENIDGISSHECPRCNGVGSVNKIEDHER